jgi:ABC-type phosphate transport system substrate-binding protein
VVVTHTSGRDLAVSFEAMNRSIALLLSLALLAVAGAAGCGNSDDDSSAPPTQAAAKPAPKAPASADRLDASDASILSGVTKTVGEYCASKHKATPGEVTAAVATLESLYEIDPTAVGADEKTVKQVAVAVQKQLRACGDRSAARRVAKLTR